MEDSKKKLLIVGVLLLTIVAGIFIMSTVGTGHTPVPCSTGDCDDTPIDILVKKYDEYDGDYNNAMTYYTRVVPIISKADNNPTMHIWLSRLREKHCRHTSKKIAEYCRLKELDIDEYTILRDNAVELEELTKGNKSITSAHRDIDTMLTILYRSYKALKMSEKIETDKNAKAYTTSAGVKIRTEIDKYRKTSIIKENPYVMNTLDKSTQLIDTWEREYEKYIELEDMFNSSNYIGVINYSCNTLSTHYTTQCDQYKKKAYDRYTRTADSKRPSIEVANEFKENVDCNKIKDSEYYSKCVKCRVKLNNLLTQTNATTTFQ